MLPLTVCHFVVVTPSEIDNRKDDATNIMDKYKAVDIFIHRGVLPRKCKGFISPHTLIEMQV
jgi:hypothetical protein